SAPANATAGSSFNMTVTAQDPYGNTVTNYTGTVHFSSTDGQALLPGNSPLKIGRATCRDTVKTAGGEATTATETGNGSMTGHSNFITVSATAVTHFTVSAPANATAGSSFNITVTAQDQFGNTVTGYVGTVHFSSTDGQALLPGNSPL